MKNITIFILALLLSSCINDDLPLNEEAFGNFFPFQLNNEWIYDVENSSDSNPNVNFTETDNVRVSSVINNNFNLIVNDDISPANGTLNTILGSGDLSQSDSELFFNGTIDFNEFDIPLNTSISLTNFLLYDLNASFNSIFEIDQNSISDTLEIDGETFPITINYEFTNERLPNELNFTVNDFTYSSTLKTEIKLQLTVTINLGGLIGNVTLLEPQNVLSMTNYYAENVGLIQSEAQQGFEISPTLLNILNTLGINAEFPENVSVLNVQKLDEFIPAN